MLPLDKELSAYLSWRWLRVGFEWVCITGKLKVAGEKVLDDARSGGIVIYERKNGCTMEGGGTSGSVVEVKGDIGEEAEHEPENEPERQPAGGAAQGAGKTRKPRSSRENQNAEDKKKESRVTEP